MRRTLTAVATAVVMTVALLTNTPVAHADELATAKAKLAALQEEASQVGELYDQAQMQVAAENQTAATITDDIALQYRKVYSLEHQAAATALQEFQSRNIDPALRILAVGGPDKFLDQLAIVTKVESDRQRILSNYQLEGARLSDLQREQAAAVKRAQDAEAKAADLKRQVDAKVAEANQLVARLTGAELAALYGDSGQVDVSRLNLDGSSDRIQTVVRYAVKQAGKSYVWGADGPDSFDCSGLMLSAYRQVGIALPHSSRVQSTLGSPVKSVADLEPGDLLFWYSPVHHVGMYIGDGLFVHARNPQVGVVVQPVASYPVRITAMRRILS